MSYTADGWSAFGSGPSGLSARINTLAVAEANPIRNQQAGAVIYFGGSWLSISGVASGNVAYYDTRTSAWSGMGLGCNDEVLAVAAKDNSTAFFGGKFTACDGAPSASKIAKWSNGAWSAMGSSLNGNVYGLAYVSYPVFSVAPAEYVLATGDFTVPGITYSYTTFLGNTYVSNIQLNNAVTRTGVAMWEMPGRNFGVSDSAWFCPFTRPYAYEATTAVVAAFIGGEVGPDAVANFTDSLTYRGLDSVGECAAAPVSAVSAWIKR